YSFHINYRNRLLFVEVAADQVAFTLLDGPAIPLTVYDQKYTLKDRLVLPIRKEEVHV
ncbi:glycosyl hydrolase family 65 protein, partial [Enterococcus faecium]